MNTKSFWGDDNIRTIMFWHRFEHHSISHNPSCFKKGCECRFLFPFCYKEATRLDPEELDPEVLVPWHWLKDPEVVWLLPWHLIPKSDIGCEYINTYNRAFLTFLIATRTFKLAMCPKCITLHYTDLNPPRKKTVKECNGSFMHLSDGC